MSSLASVEVVGHYQHPPFGIGQGLTGGQPGKVGVEGPSTKGLSRLPDGYQSTGQPFWVTKENRT